MKTRQRQQRRQAAEGAADEQSGASSSDKKGSGTARRALTPPVDARYIREVVGHVLVPAWAGQVGAERKPVCALRESLPMLQGAAHQPQLWLPHLCRPAQLPAHRHCIIRGQAGSLVTTAAAASAGGGGLRCSGACIPAGRRTPLLNTLRLLKSACAAAAAAGRTGVVGGERAVGQRLQQQPRPRGVCEMQMHACVQCAVVVGPAPWRGRSGRDGGALRWPVASDTQQRQCRDGRRPAWRRPAAATRPQRSSRRWPPCPPAAAAGTWGCRGLRTAPGSACR